MGFSLSKKEIVKEIVKSGKDPQYFINNYCRISHPMHGLIPFKTYPYQDDLINDFNDFRFTVILKARQLGISTISAAYAVWFMLFHRDKNILVIATKFSTASGIVAGMIETGEHEPTLEQTKALMVKDYTDDAFIGGNDEVHEVQITQPSEEDEKHYHPTELIEESLSLQDNENEMIRKALEKHQGKRKNAAKELGISERTLYRKIKEYNIKQ